MAIDKSFKLPDDKAVECGSEQETEVVEVGVEGIGWDDRNGAEDKHQGVEDKKQLESGRIEVAEAVGVEPTEAEVKESEMGGTGIGSRTTTHVAGRVVQEVVSDDETGGGDPPYAAVVVEAAYSREAVGTSP